MAGNFTVRCSGTRGNGRRCTNMVDARTEEGRHYCSNAECQRSYNRHYYQTPEGKAKNAERVRRRRQNPEVRAREAAAQRVRDQARRAARASA